MSSNPHRPDSDDWLPVSKGELCRMVDRLDASKKPTVKSPAILAVLTLATIASVGVGIGIFSKPSHDHAPYGGITCLQCKENIADYHDHLTETLVLADAKLVESMRLHLKECKRCRKLFEKTYPGILTVESSATRPAVIVALQPHLIESETTIALVH